jgi:CheY-like chemotaxis protein
MTTAITKACKLLLEWPHNTQGFNNWNGQQPAPRRFLVSSIDKKRPLTNNPYSDKTPASTGHGDLSNGINPSPEGTIQPFRLMVVDDEPDIVRVMKYGLEKKGFEVQGFTDSLQALEQFRPGQYDVVLLDIRMPKMDGIELYRRLRLMDRNVVICFVSAYEQYKKQFEITHPDEQIDCFIPKPFRIDSLATIITSRIEERHSRNY